VAARNDVCHVIRNRGVHTSRNVGGVSLWAEPLEWIDTTKLLAGLVTPNDHGSRSDRDPVRCAD
jgi:hypothetical protein